MKILVTGATGTLGSKVVAKLLESVPAKQLAISVRNPEKAEALRTKGVDVRQCDFDHPEALVSTFAGVDRLLITSTDGKVGWATQEYYTDNATAVLVGTGHENTVYELSGKLLTQEELASLVGHVLHKQVTVQHVDDDTYADVMKGAGVLDFAIPNSCWHSKKHPRGHPGCREQ